MTAATAEPRVPIAARQRRRLLDAIGFAVVVARGVVSRRPVRPLGDEERRPLPGDGLLPDAKGRWTHAITIHASPAEIWPWLVQMGCRRGGWYRYDGLDNGSVPSADRIHPELQEIAPIDARTTRLLARASGDYERRSVGLYLHVIGRPMHFAMQRKQLLTLRKRIEAAAIASTG